jgi:hypothetical protein
MSPATRSDNSGEDPTAAVATLVVCILVLTTLTTPRAGKTHKMGFLAILLIEPYVRNHTKGKIEIFPLSQRQRISP